MSFTGRAYYNFDREVHAVRRLRYNPNLPLVLGFDFNREPGVAVYLQELFVEGLGWCTSGIGEVWIAENSNSRKVAQRIVRDWHAIHRGEVHVYGDATGGAGGSAKVDGSDWDLVRAELEPWLGERLKMFVPGRNPSPRARVNAVNTRLLAADGSVRLLVDPISAPHVIEDLYGVTVKPGGSGEFDRPTSGQKSLLTHVSDALGYYVARQFPVEVGGRCAGNLIRRSRQC